MQHIPGELIVHIADEFLNPCERSRLSTSSRHLRGLLPSSLRIKIISSRGDGSLQPEFFVSPVNQPNKVLSTDQNLVYGCQYHLWTFDYDRGNKVFLGRHTRHGHKTDDNGDLQYIYTLGLRPRSPNQSWEVIGGDDGDIVMWGEDVGLSVGGANPKPRQPDSSERGLLSCIPSTKYPSWGVLEETWGTNEKLQLFRCEEFVPGEDVEEKDLIIHAVPEVCDEGEYLLHSPKSLEEGYVQCEGYHVIVDFHFWIEQGIMRFHAPVLPFTLGIPILQADAAYKSTPLANLLEIKSARWGCVMYYMAVAADVSEGKSLDMERFLRRVTDHRDHEVVYDDESKNVYIDVKHKKVNGEAPSLPREKNALWKFILSW